MIALPLGPWAPDFLLVELELEPYASEPYASA